MLGCVVVDDEPLAVKMLESFVTRTDGLTLMGSWNDPVEALSRIREIRPDIVFLDIQMPDLDGLELARMIPEGTKVIFTTAFKEYAFDSYEVSAIDFLLKPIRYHKFLEAVEKAKEWFTMKNAALAAPAKDDSIFVKVDGDLVKVTLSDILFIEGMKDYVMIRLASQKTPLVTHMTMKAAESLLPQEQFMRVHRSYIVNLDRIGSISSGKDITIGDTFIHVGDAYADDFDKFITPKTLSR